MIIRRRRKPCLGDQDHQSSSRFLLLLLFFKKKTKRELNGWLGVLVKQIECKYKYVIFFKANGKAQQPTSWGEGGASSSSPLLLECPDLYNQLCGIGSFLQITISPSLIKRKSKVISFFLILKDCI